jgi:mannitol-1-phosphate 5-dehydrogenase
MPLKILIYGAGAIGRGFLGPLFSRYDVELSFVDIDPSIIDKMRQQRQYKAAVTTDAGYEIIDVPVKEAFLLGEEKDIEDHDIIFSCVGPNNCYDLAEKFKKARAVISCENDASTALKLRELSGNPHIYFGIPDVITSNTASTVLKKTDPLTTITEKGILVIEKGNYVLPGEILQVGSDELHMHWMCKLFIHNTPHAIVAYLGWLKGYTYIHEAMADPDIEDVVVGSIHEMTQGVIAAKYVPEEFACMYREKELKRFRNKFLYDTVARVAREPLRKMRNDNRIILGLRIALFSGILPEYTAIGAKAALAYDDAMDKEAVYLQSLRASLDDSEVLRRYSGIEAFDPLGKYIISQDLSKFRKRSLECTKSI